MVNYKKKMGVVVGGSDDNMEDDVMALSNDEEGIEKKEKILGEFLGIV